MAYVMLNIYLRGRYTRKALLACLTNMFGFLFNLNSIFPHQRRDDSDALSFEKPGKTDINT